jgi:hypothetical protein
VVSFLGAPYPTRMAIARLPDGGLWLWSPVELDEARRAAVDALGPVRHLVSPNAIHHLFLGPWKDAYPDAKLWASPGLARRRKDLAFDGTLDDAPPADWAGAIDQVHVDGSPVLTELWFHHRESRTALVCDLVQKHDPDALDGWMKWLMRLDGLVGPEGSTPREWRATFLRRGVARAAVRRALDWDPRRVVIAHGDWAREDGRRWLERSMAWLLG